MDKNEITRESGNPVENPTTESMASNNILPISNNMSNDGNRRSARVHNRVESKKNSKKASESITPLERKTFNKKKKKLVAKLSKLISLNLKSKITKENIMKYSDSYFINLLKQRLKIEEKMPICENKIQREMDFIFEKKIIEKEKICSICLDETTSESRHYLRCGHFFHNDCLLRWFEENSQCPVCRLVLHKDYSKINFSENNSDESNEWNFSMSSTDDLDYVHPEDFFNNVVFVLVVYILVLSLIKTVGLIKFVLTN
jgi:hypothetical protein